MAPKLPSKFVAPSDILTSLREAVDEMEKASTWKDWLSLEKKLATLSRKCALVVKSQIQPHNWVALKPGDFCQQFRCQKCGAHWDGGNFDFEGGYVVGKVPNSKGLAQAGIPLDCQES